MKIQNEDFEFKLILPKNDNSGNRINPETHKHYASELAKRFGGVTIIPDVLGCWINQKGILQCEKNMIMVANRDNKVWDSDKKKLWQPPKRQKKKNLCSDSNLQMAFEYY